MNEIILSTLQNDLTYFKNLLNFLEYISDCFSESSTNDYHFLKSIDMLYDLINLINNLISDIQNGRLSFEYKK